VRRGTKTRYRGFSIEKEAENLFAGRYYQDISDWPAEVRQGQSRLMNDYKPWCDSIEEAKQVVDKLIARAEADEPEADMTDAEVDAWMAENETEAREM
jgi:hypothetical protein